VFSAWHRERGPLLLSGILPLDLKTAQETDARAYEPHGSSLTAVHVRNGAPEPPALSDRLEAAAQRSAWFGLAVALAIALGVGVRAFHALSGDFPLNDGGLFYAMAHDLQTGGYRLPAFTSYNQLEIPFAYPPLGFYAAALLADLTPLSLFDAFRFLPFVATSLTLPAFYLLARSLLTSRVAVLAALLAFALIPRTFIWLLMGGGVSRSLGFLFAILALYFVHRLYARRDSRAILPATLLAALTVLSHLETGWFLACSIAVFFIAFGRHRHGVSSSALVLFGTLAITAPWWAAVLGRHGLEPFLAAQATGGSIFSDGSERMAALMGLLRVTSTSEPLFPLIGVLALLGGFISIARGNFLLPAWWATIILLDVRAYPTFTTVPVALMAGIGVAQGLVPMVAYYGARTSGAANGSSRKGQRAGADESFTLRPAGIGLLAVLFLYVTVGAGLRAPGLAGEASFLVSLSKEERAAMTWIREETPTGSRFLVVPDGGWPMAKAAEWFPVLTRRTSVATVQGTEWLPQRGFARMVESFDLAFECGYRTVDCLDELVLKTGLHFDYVYLSGSGEDMCCWTLVNSLWSDDRYRVVYHGPGATIFERIPDPADLPAVRESCFAPEHGECLRR
jgi:hypothetical protein